jgi:mRNA interferase MazF
MLAMLRGEVWWVDFVGLASLKENPSVGGEIRKIRPAVIVSNDASNMAMNRIQVIPLTTNTSRIYPSEAVVLVDGKECKAMADQLTTASKERFKSQLGTLTIEEMKAIEKIIKIQLGMQP